MKVAPELNEWILFLVLALPGLISMHVYRLLFAAAPVDWKGGLLQALFYSSLNLALCLPILIPIHRDDFVTNHPWLYTAALVAVLLVLPASWPLLGRLLLKWPWLKNKILLPYPTAWDFYFYRRNPCFVLFHLKNGAKLGGLYDTESYATSYPREGDIYVQTIYPVDENGEFGDPIEDSAGAIVRKDQYDLVEFFSIPKEENNDTEDQ